MLATLEALAAALHTDPAALTPAQLCMLAIQPRQLHLERYLSLWWDADAGTKAKLAHAVLRFLVAVESRNASELLGLPGAQREVWQALAEHTLQRLGRQDITVRLHRPMTSEAAELE